MQSEWMTEEIRRRQDRDEHGMNDSQQRLLFPELLAHDKIQQINERHNKITDRDINCLLALE